MSCSELLRLSHNEVDALRSGGRKVKTVDE